jgi:hypothetical protein
VGGSVAGKYRTHTALVSGSPEEVLQGVGLVVAGLPKHTFAAGGPNTMVITREYYSTWRIVVAIFLFPIGLIALASRDRVTASVVATPAESGRTRMQLMGNFSGDLVGALNRVID